MENLKNSFLSEYAKKNELSFPSAITSIYEVSACLKDSEEKRIYLLHAYADGREYILKVTSRFCKEDLKTEYLLLNSLSHKGLPRAVFYFEQGEHSYLVREYEAGHTLEELIEKKGGLTADESVRIIIKICEILCYLHGENPPVIHRDIKPQNVIMTPDGELRLIDLGISRRYHESGKKDTVFMGTEATAAPEQFGYRQTDMRSDIYSLGVLMFYLLTGSLDIQRLDLYKIDVHLKRIIKKCIEFSPDDRFASVNQLKSRLNRYRKAPRVLIKVLVPLCIIVLSLSFLLPFILGKHTGPSDNVTFSSPLIEKAVLKELGKGEGESVTYAELQNIKKLLICGDTIYSDWDEHRMYGKGHHLNGAPYQDANGSITSLEDLTLMKNLTEAALYQQNITDLTPLKELKLLRLGLGSNGIRDISVLKEINTLTCLNIADNPITDITPVEGLITLNELDISCTAINDISAVSGLFIANLSMLDTPVTDYSPLFTLPRLEEFRGQLLSEEAVNTVVQLTFLKNLTLYSCGISDLGIFSQLSRLEYLDVYANEIQNIDSIGSLKNLKHIGLGGNKFTDLSPITALQELTSLDINNTFVSSYAPLAELPALKFLSCCEDQLMEIKSVLGDSEIQIWTQN